jgi:hypothetical protein
VFGGIVELLKIDLKFKKIKELLDLNYKITSITLKLNIFSLL